MLQARRLRVAGSLSADDGTQSTTLPRLSEVCKGFRRGELVLISGPTGGNNSFNHSVRIYSIEISDCSSGLCEHLCLESSEEPINSVLSS